MLTFLSATPQAGWGFWRWVAFFIANKYPEFISGAGITLLISITGTVIGFLIGLLIGVIKTIPLRPNDAKIKIIFLKILRGLLQIYIEIFRGTPMMVQAMVIFYGLATAGLQLNRIFAGILIVSINTGAYMSEIVRGGIESIDKGQFEAAHTLGMSHGKTMFNIILPQTIRNILPATGNEFVINIKDTSVLSVISVTELFFASKSIAGTYVAYFQTMTITCAIYFVLTFTVTRILRLLEKKIDGPSSYTIYGSSTSPESTIKVKGGETNAR
ncbi:MAG: amino acid ABC transporter permease [Bacillota bacterium]|nr:amino acid ABC transporter permease [Bacillota bacterium]